MIDAFPTLLSCFQKHTGQVSVQSGRYVLIGYYPDLFALLQLLQNPESKIDLSAGGPRSVDHAGPGHAFGIFLAQQLGITVMADRVSVVRLFAAFTLGNMGDKSVIFSLKLLLKDPIPLVTRAAQEAISKLQNQKEAVTGK